MVIVLAHIKPAKILFLKEYSALVNFTDRCYVIPEGYNIVALLLTKTQIFYSLKSLDDLRGKNHLNSTSLT